jgi:hypothetical protein
VIPVMNMSASAGKLTAGISDKWCAGGQVARASDAMTG